MPLIFITSTTPFTRLTAIVKFSGNMDAQGQPEYEPILMPTVDPANNEFMTDKDGNIILAPVSEEGTEFTFTKFQVKIESSSYNDEDEKAQLMLETVIGGQVGIMMSQVNPAGFFQMASLAIKSQKTKYSPNISKILEETSQMLGGDPAAQEEAKNRASGGTAGQPLSRELKLPQNTNEGVG